MCFLSLFRCGLLYCCNFCALVYGPKYVGTYVRYMKGTYVHVHKITNTTHLSIPLYTPMEENKVSLDTKNHQTLFPNEAKLKQLSFAQIAHIALLNLYFVIGNHRQLLTLPMHTKH